MPIPSFATKDFTGEDLGYAVDGDLSNWAEVMKGIYSICMEIGYDFVVA